MGEEDTVDEVAEKAPTGASSLEKIAQDVTEKREGRSQEVKEIEEAKKTKPENIDEDPKVNVKEESKDEKHNREGSEEKEDNQADTMEMEALLKIKGKMQEKNEEKVEDADQDKEGEEKAEENQMKDKGRKKPERKILGGKSKEKSSKVEEKKQPEQRTPATNRPVRERKPVERLVTSMGKESIKELQIEQGQGTPLKDIPNVAFKLSRRKTEDTFKQLHTILFGRRGKAFQIKSNIAEFSGFVWHGNEEKQKIKVMEKFDKCNKETLLEFCDLLDIPIAKATTKKEDIVKMLIDFLVAPYATTTVPLTEKEKTQQSSKGTKRKTAVEYSSTNSEGVPSTKSRKQSDGSEKKSAHDSEDELEEKKEDDEKEVGKRSENSEKEKSAPDNKDELQEEKENEKNGVDGKDSGSKRKPDDDTFGHSGCEEKNVSKDDGKEHKQNLQTTSRNKESGGKPKSKRMKVSNQSSPLLKKTSNPSSKHTKVDVGSVKNPTAPSKKNQNERVAKVKKLPNRAKSKPSTPSESLSREKAEKRKTKRKEKAKVETTRPTDFELRDAICEILKGVDFNTTTLGDIMRQLAKQFSTDLMPRKQSIKLMLQEEYIKLEKDTDDRDG